jgi:hypothetical protein
VQSLAAQVIGAVAEQRATWSVWNVRAQAERIVRRAHPSGTLEQHVQLVEEVTAVAVAPAHSVVVSAPALLEEPRELRRSDGVSVFEQHASTRYTSRAVLDAEARLRDAALRPTAVGLSGPFTQASLDGFEGRKRPLDEGQRALVTAFATDTRLVVVGLGPAGSGKTAAMQAYVHVAAQAGQRVIPLATSAASAQVLGEDLGLTAENLHKFLWEWTRGPAAERLRRGLTVPPSRESFALHPGDVVLLDEAGMAGTFNLDRLVRIAASRGAVVRLLGDYRQLGAVESGGALREIAATAGAVELTRLHRFIDPAEAEATLAIRVGDNTGLDFYQRADRLRGGSRTAMTAGCPGDSFQARTEALLSGSSRARDSVVPGEEEVVHGPFGAVDIQECVDRERVRRVAVGVGHDQRVVAEAGQRADQRVQSPIFVILLFPLAGRSGAFGHSESPVGARAVGWIACCADDMPRLVSPRRVRNGRGDVGAAVRKGEPEGGLPAPHECRSGRLGGLPPVLCARIRQRAPSPSVTKGWSPL